MAKVRDLLSSSLRLLGAIATGETPSAAEQADALAAVNRMVDSWSNEELLIYADVVETFNLVPGQQTYTMGPSGNFNTVRPQRIEKARLQTVTSGLPADLPLTLVTLDEWARIIIKTQSSSLPLRLYIEENYPLMNLNLWPIPNIANKIVLWSWKPLTRFATVDDDVSFPPGYERMIVYNGALELAPEYGREPSATVLSTAIESKANIKRMNTQPSYLSTDSAIRSRNRRFNILKGD